MLGGKSKNKDKDAKKEAASHKKNGFKDKGAPLLELLP